MLIKKRALLTAAVIFFINMNQYAQAVPQMDDSSSIQEQFATLEASDKGLLGISAVNTANNQKIDYRANQRFPMGCTSKVLGVSAILKKSMSDSTFLDQKITYTKENLVSWSPITEQHIKDGMTISELSRAAITVSDNTAMNLLTTQLGGLQALNNFVRTIMKDNISRIDHAWPDEALSGGENNVADTSTPATMEYDLQQLAFGSILGVTQRQQLTNWLKNDLVGDARIRAGVPKGWIVGDKTGTGAYYGTTNDIGIIWPPRCAPIILAIYFTHTKKNTQKREDIIAAATRIVIDEFARTDSCLKAS